MSGWQFWIDRGGTFTDIVALTPGGQLLTEKLLSVNSDHYADAAHEGIQRLLRRSAESVTRAIDGIRLGTTLGTNALLEQRGVPTAILLNRGFGDLLSIGDQSRPDLFARTITPRQILHQATLEVAGRLDAHGQELEAPDLPKVKDQLMVLRGRGIESIAIALLHAWRNPAHELALGAVAREVGFREVVLSHQISSAPKLTLRAQTAALDAYLTPILRDYLDGLKARIAQINEQAVPIDCMQSNGGLIAHARFRGRDSILSGPAGGVSGAITVARQLGFEKLITFDMGGTSTDVAHYAGQLERRHEQNVSGFRFTAPGLQIHTVAAGGGSILRFDEGRLLVGPESAGADPGPACYGRGGPLTITDAHLLLGRLQPDFLPPSFGKSGDQPLDVAHVERQFEALALEVSRETGITRSARALAEAFLEVAAEHMALAIRSVSIERGFDLREGYALVAFGGAGGQQACQVATRLGIGKIISHPLAGVLSALGIGLSEKRRILEKTILAPCSRETLAGLLEEIPMMIQHGEGPLDPARKAARQVDVRVAIRYEGTDHALDVDLHPIASLKKRFEAAYVRAFGLQRRGVSLFIERLTVEEAEAAPLHDLPRHSIERHLNPLPQPRFAHVYVRGDSERIPVMSRHELRVGACIQGPCLILDPGATLYLESGWDAQKQVDGTLILRQSTQRADATQRAADPESEDPLKLELFNRRFMAVAEEMGHVLRKTAQSVNIKERLDFSCALFDAQGDLVANAPHIPVHLGSMGESVKALMRRHGAAFRPGDAWLINSPYEGGTHLPDITVVSPLMDPGTGRALFFVASRGHHADIGGITPGSMPPWSQSIEEEGVSSDGLLILREGRFMEKPVRCWLASGPHPARNPAQNIQDLMAQIAANNRGLHGLQQLIAGHGVEEVSNYMAYVQALAARLVRSRLRGLKSGSMRLEMDSGAIIQVSIRIEPEGESALIDFSGTSEQQKDNFNAPKAVTHAAVLYVLRLLCDKDIPLNEGCLSPIQLIVPEGSFLNPRPPSAVVAGNVETSQHVVDALLGALGIMAASQGTMNNLTFGSMAHQYYETIGGGCGASAGGPGADGVQTHMTNSRMTDPEVLESRFPVRVEAFCIRQGSGGKGRFRGGHGLIRRIRFLEPMVVSLLSTRRRTRPFGLHGGTSGSSGRASHIRAGCVKALQAREVLSVQALDAIEIETPGGGGYGLEPAMASVEHSSNPHHQEGR